MKPAARYPQPIGGFHQRVRAVAGLLLAAAFFAAPWITVGGAPLVRLDFLSGRFFLLAQALPTSELFHFILLLLPAGLGLFLAASLYGRIWCGYACPQMVFVDLGLRAIDGWIEGSPEARRRRDAQAAAGPRIARRMIRHAAYALVSAAFAFHLVALFCDPRGLLSGAHPVAATVGAIVALTAYVDGAFLREKFCALMCPYARFQSLLVDSGTRQLGYVAARGEPRGRRAAGSCVDCGLCVRVCPAGIDIREGFNQLECFNCARCIDACDQVMANLGRGRGLIRYETEARATMGAGDPLPARAPLARPRTLAYASALCAMVVWGAYDFLARPPFRLQALNLTPQGYVLEGERVKALVRVRVSNLSATAETYRFALARESTPGARIESAPPGAPIAPGEEGGALLLLSFARTEAAHGATRAGPHPVRIVLEARAESGGARREVELALPRPGP